jgi:hypothetical protein
MAWDTKFARRLLSFYKGGYVPGIAIRAVVTSPGLKRRRLRDFGGLWAHMDPAGLAHKMMLREVLLLAGSGLEQRGDLVLQPVGASQLDKGYLGYVLFCVMKKEMFYGHEKEFHQTAKFYDKLVEYIF